MWNVTVTMRTAKQIKKLPVNIQASVLLLIKDLQKNGPSASKSWKNYGKLKGFQEDIRHCHLSKGRPTYVCCWEVVDKKIKIIEVCYVGTHEKAPY